MSLLKLDYTMSSVQGKHKHLMLSLAEFQKFNVESIGLGDVTRYSEPVDSVAAIFDLEGFTSFCGQVDQHLVVPDYLGKLLKWLFSEIAACFAKEYTPEGVILWGKFPFFSKFTGDGVLFLWDTKGLGPASLGNIIVNIFRVCSAYTKEFYPRIEKEFNKTPKKLRCGIARGEVISIGGSKDFVGPCINLSSRLQKISDLSFAFSRRGLDPEQCFSKTWQDRFMLKRAKIRGLSESELVLIFKDEYMALSDHEKELFQDP